MTKTLVCLTLFCLFAISLGGDCSNPLLSVYGFVATGASAASVSGLSYCKSLKSSPTCCDAATVNSFQTKVDTLTTKLTTAVITRDKAISEAKNKIIPELQESIQALKDLATKAAANAQAAASATSASTMAQSFDVLTQQVTGTLSDLKGAFNGFQRSRTSCIKEIVQLQAASWCLACDPDYTAKGVAADKSIQIGTDTCTRLQSSCFGYIAGSVVQSSLLSLKQVNTLITAFTTVLTKVSNGDLSSLGDLTSALTGQTSDPTEVKPVTFPSGCTSADKCSWICTNLFSKGLINEDALVLGGVTSDLTTILTAAATAKAGRLLEGEEEVEVEEGSVVKNMLSKKRVLTGNEWNPDSDEAGVTVTFEDDPAGVKEEDGAAIVKSGFVCLMALLAILLF